MKSTVNLNQFRDAFKNMGRENQFSYEGLEVLFDSLNYYEEGTGVEIELDVIAFCCEYTEMTEQEVKDAYNSASDYDNVEEFLSENTWYCGKTEQNTFVFQSF